MPPDQMQDVRGQIESGALPVPAEMQRAILSRIDDLIADIDSADQALAYTGRPDPAEAAARAAHLFYISGHGWKKFLSGTAESARAGIVIGLALRERVAPVLAQLTASIVVSRTSVVKLSSTSYTLTCCACGADAVTFSTTRTGPEAPEQLVVSSLSPVTVFRPIAGPRMQDLLALLDGGDAAEVVKYMTVTQPAGCDAHCPTCGGVFCKEHTAIEAQWTGSWHEATYATCPLGHEREIE